MRKIITLAISAIFLLFAKTVDAQLTENFNDGDFTNNPTWTGSSNADWLVNSALQLQSNNTVANSTFYLSTANKLATTAQWEFYARIDFNPSSLNYIDVYLTASAADISANNTTGYFVRIGNTDDEISLYRKDVNGVTTKIIDGANGILNTSASVMKIRVIRNASNQWSLLRDLSGTGTTYVSEGVVSDATYTTSNYFGFLIKQSTSSFFQKHYFDDIEIKPYAPDVTPPAIQSATAVSANSVDVLFSEPVDLNTSQTAINYVVNNSIGAPASAVRDAANTSLVHLTFAANFPNGTTNTITINGVQDLAGNAISNGTATFSFYTPQRYDVLIDEIMAHQSPVVSLPAYQYVELKNVSGKAINLQGWKLTTSTSVTGTFASYILPADSFLIITGTTAAPNFTSYGRVLSVTSFPTLPQSGTTLSLISKEGVTVHSVSYTDAWYKNDVKSTGGWSLEMIDTHNPCNEANNWKASVDLRGGTPGTKNSVDGANPDQTAPALLRAAALDSVTLVLTFSEPLDSSKAATAANYSISDGISLSNAVAIAPGFKQVQLTLTKPLVQAKVYTVTANNVSDCSGNAVQAAKTTRVGLPSVIDSFGIVVNEILYYPPSGGVDYIEIYNRSNNVYDLKNLYLANRSSTTLRIGSIKQVSADNLLLFPGDFYVLTPTGDIVKQQYATTNPDNFIDVTSFPTFPNDKGYVVLLNAQGNIVDEVDYSDGWQNPLVSNSQGVALERIDYNKPSNDKNNWTSAASTVGYGTPGYKNSQFRSDLGLQGEVTVTPKVFSPDNDGYDDFAIITYKLDDPTYVANITIFDATGRPVRSLAKNATLAQTGTFRWDGFDDRLNKVPVGPYVIYTEVFNLSGKKKSFKNTVIVAARF